MSLPNFAIKFAMEKAGAAVGDPVGAALAAIGATGAFAVAEVSNLVDRTDSAQPVRLSDVAAAAAAPGPAAPAAPDPALLRESLGLRRGRRRRLPGGGPNHLPARTRPLPRARRG